MHPPSWNGQLDLIYHTMGSQTISCSGLWYLQISIDYYGEWCQIHNYNMVDGFHRAAVALNSALMIIYIYIYIYIYILWAVKWGIYQYISMDTRRSMMLLFTRSSRIHRANVGSHAIIFKSLCFGPLTLKRNPRVFKLKRVCSILKRVENTGVV